MFGAISILAGAYPFVADLFGANWPGTWWVDIVCPIPLLIALVLTKDLRVASRVVSAIAATALVAAGLLQVVSNFTESTEGLVLYGAAWGIRVSAWMAVAMCLMTERISPLRRAVLGLLGGLTLAALVADGFLLHSTSDIVFDLWPVVLYSELILQLLFLAAAWMVCLGLSRRRTADGTIATPFYVAIVILFLIQNGWAMFLHGGLRVYLAWALYTVCIEIASCVAFMVLLYRVWSLIQGEHARTTPGKAVGFSFIPLFNIYWLYVAWVGLAHDLNEYVRRHALPARRLSPGLFLFVVYFGPLAQILNQSVYRHGGPLAMASMVFVVVANLLALKVVWDLCHVANWIAMAPAGGHAQGGIPPASAVGT